MSDRKQEAAKRRDIKNTRVPDEVGKRPAGKKNTNKWCRGKVGVEHKTKCVNYRDTKNTHVGSSFEFSKGWKLLICTECGKELKRYYPFIKGRPPEWVV